MRPFYFLGDCMKSRNELYHHGILGQKWGKKNGPPYPLKSADHSASEKKAGWKKSLNKYSGVDTKSKKTYTSDQKIEKKRLTPDQKKRLIKIGAAVVVTSLTAYGGYQIYKNGGFDSFAKIIKNGQGVGNNLMVGAVGETSAPSVGPYTQSQKATEYISSIRGSLEKANPLKHKEEGKNNCGPCALAGYLRDCGLYPNATAKGTGGKMLSSYDLIQECFSGIKEEGKDRNLLELNNAIKFSKGYQDASDLILRKLKVEEGAEGICAVNWKKRLPNGDIAGHIYSWKAISGDNGLEIVFKDYNQGYAGKDIDYYFNSIDPEGRTLIARLEQLIPNEEALEKYVNKN